MQKWNENHIELIKGIGIKDDAHAGTTVKHRSRVAKDPSQPNLRQVHLIHSELFQELKAKGFDITPGLMGENITTSGIDLLSLPKDTILTLGENAKIIVTGLRNPCHQLNGIQEGLMNAVLDKTESGELIRKAGIMGVVIESGIISIGDQIDLQLPPEPHIKLDRG
jgi:MOSC domain-containing protein YiiM